MRPRSDAGASALAGLAVAVAFALPLGAAVDARNAAVQLGELLVAGGTFNRDLYVLDGGPVPSGARLTDTPGLSEGEPTWGPGRASVAFAAPRDEPPLSAEAAIWRLDPAAGALVALSVGPDDHDPDWSPDGSEVAFASRLEVGAERVVTALAAARADGASQRLLAEPLDAQDAFVACPRWSPDGRALAFVVARRGEGELYRLDLDAGRVARWLARPGWDDVEPAWSPDGRLIAFASGHRAPGALVVEHGLWLFEPATGAVGLLLAVPGTDLRRPSWSPTGDQLAYTAAPRGEPARVHRLSLLAPAHGEPLWTTPADAVDWAAPPALEATATVPIPTATEGATATEGPTPDATPTAPILPTLPPLPPFPTLPAGEPTLPPAAPTFPLPTATPGGPTATPSLATATATGQPPAFVATIHLPVALAGADLAAP